MNKNILIKKLLIGGIVFSSIMANTQGTFALESRNANSSIQDISTNDTSIDIFNEDSDIIAISDNYVRMNLSTKRLELNNEDELRNKLNQEEFNYIKECVETVNHLIENGEVTVMDDGTMYLTNEITARGGKINRSEVKYWGIRRYNNQANTTSAANTLIKNGKSFKNITSVPKSVLAIIGLAGLGTPVNTIVAAIGIGNAFGNWMYNVGTQLKKKNNKYGTVLDISWNASYKVWKQTNSTK